MSRIIGRALRAWWPELLYAAFLTPIGFVAGKDGLWTVMFCLVFGAVFWAMGFRHRRTPLHAKVDRISETVDDVKDILTTQAPAQAPYPELTVLKGGRLEP
jgi:hypothetical protein